MIEICEAMIIFGRKDETEDVPKPRFRGTRGEEFEHICEKEERTFAENLQAIRVVQQNILDVTASSWYDDIMRFRGQMKDTEMILENLMISVFEQVVNLEEGVHALQAFYYYSKRDGLRPLYDKKTVAVYKMFGEEIQATKKGLVEKKASCPAGLPPFAGRVLMIHLKKRHFTKLMKILDDAQWMPPCGMRDEVRTQYEELIVSMDDLARDLYEEWNDSLDENISARLDKPLIVRSHTRPGLLESNFDRVVGNICHEARIWERMKYDIPTVVQSVYNKWDKLKFVYESVLTVVMDYNQVIEALSDEERLLFRELINVCDKKINPGLFKLKWNTEISEKYLSDCSIHISELQHLVDDFKNFNLEIVSICEAICDTPLIYVDTSHVYELKELDCHLSNFRDEAMAKILAHYECIIQCIVTVYEGFEEYIPLMSQHWVHYINKMDGVIEEALKQCVRASLQVMLEALHGDGTTGPTQILKVSATLKNSAISFEPSLTTVATLITSTLPGIVDSLMPIPRLAEKFKLTPHNMQAFWAAVEKDDECKWQQGLITQEMATVVSQIQNYLKIWESFRDLWEVNTDLLIQRYENLKPSVSSFDADIRRCTGVVNNVQLQESVSPVHFIMINSMQLKHSIIEHCCIWQDKLAKLLLQLTYNRIRDSYHYTKENSEKVLRIPQSHKELEEANAVHQRLFSEIPEREAIFPVIRDQYDILLKYEVEITEDFINLLNGLGGDWKKFLSILEESEQKLERDKKGF
ncbi:hypothetical protein B7P43_G00884 [Cryptotermes secundus]|uniref:Uncharacterized protein n=2 Tax=Cryptotermes secundus TaxID=105785 RepID=A0A2J7PKD6_9NEOP|nr:hypothetical protein B7P43_G00884 [Cryptotermes secundus]